ncbi:XRE family transcriptional regulator [Bacillus sp. S13(2024)]|uniref:helix-turn-helix domain-containing protein n=1 Tax=Bacillus sp. S13(2024) TaxID=3162885 RepID=UPI003D1BF5E0
MQVKLHIKLDTLLKELIKLIEEKTNKKVRPASISELYNNQRKSLNKELIEIIASVLEIKDATKLIAFKIV